MAASMLRKALGAFKDKTSIGLARVSRSSVSNIDVAVVKATRHEEYPAEEKHIEEILTLTCYSRAYIIACINTLSKRLNKTRNWTVALKVLVLIYRLLAEGVPAYEQEIFFATQRGTRLLNISDFRDASRKNSWDYSTFVRTFARYLDGKLEFRMHVRRGHRRSDGALGYHDEEEGEDHEDVGSETALVRAITPVRDLTTRRIFNKTSHLQNLLERFLACRPTGAAKINSVVIVALHPIVKESFDIYYDIAEIIGILIERFMELQIPDCIKVYEIFSRTGKQFDELYHFYNWCKNTGIARSSEYPVVDRITLKKLNVMDEFIRKKFILNSHSKKVTSPEQNNESKHPTETIEEGKNNAVKALPPQEGFYSEVAVKEEKEEEIYSNKQQEDDLLNFLQEHKVTSEEQGDKLALALFDGGAAVAPSASAPPAWEAFSDESLSDWETVLVQSASKLSNQNASLGGGFDMLLLNGMYQQSTAGTSTHGVTGSASSVAFGSAGKPAMLALPAAPPVAGGSVSTSMSVDPFAASLAVAPPAYVQMSEMEKKQKLLVEEQLMWQQYTRDGMQGQLGLAKLRANPYTQSY